MLERLRTVLVSSFVGAITLGWMFAQGFIHFAYVFSAPIAGWLARRAYCGIGDRAAAGFSLQEAVPELIKSISLLVVGYFLLRWLYYKPLESENRVAPQD